MRILYVSQVADDSHPRRSVAAVESAAVRRVFDALGVEAVVHDATLGPPPDPAVYDGVVVGGSLGSANDAEPWRRALRAWMAALPDTPLLGICGGHQLYATARGGEVAVAPAQQMGVFPLALPGVPGFEGQVVQLHAERVERPPEGAEVWATDEMGIQALRYGPARWTVQFHPELDGAALDAAGTREGAPEAWTALEVAEKSGLAVLRAWLAAARATRR